MPSTALTAGWRTSGAQWVNTFYDAAGAAAPTTASQASFARSRDVAARGSTVDASTTLKHAFGSAFNPRQPHEIAVEVRVTRNRDRDAIDLTDASLGATPGALAGVASLVDPARVGLETNDTDLRQREVAVQTDYTRAFTARRKLEAGLKHDARHVDRDFRDALDAAGTVFRMLTNDGQGSAISSDARALILRVNATAQVTPATLVQGGYFYRSPISVEGGRFLSTQAANMSVRQALPSGRGTLSLRAVDPFNTSRFLVQVAGSGVTQRSLRRQDMRAFYLGYQNTFGRAPKVRVLRPEASAPTPFGG